MFFREAIGGALLGFAVGWLVYRLLKSVDKYQVEILLSLALVAGGYALAEAVHVSGPIAMVVAGLLIGNHGRSFAMSPTTNEHLDNFWELVDEILNAILFVAIGLEVLVLTFTWRNLAAGLLAALAVLSARLISVGLPVWLLRRWEQFEPAMVPILTWGGLRGGISVALALSLPGPRQPVGIPGRSVILAITYVVVVFSILVQGLTIGRLTRHGWRSRAVPCKARPKLQRSSTASRIPISSTASEPSRRLGLLFAVIRADHHVFDRRSRACLRNRQPGCSSPFASLSKPSRDQVAQGLDRRDGIGPGCFELETGAALGRERHQIQNGTPVSRAIVN